jgi:hypothetical protein
MAALVLEDGSVVSGANTYALRATAIAYLTDRNKGAIFLAASGAVQDAKLIEAREFMDSSYSWRGQIASDEQETRWPRKCVTDRDGREIASDAIPTAIIYAQIEVAALLATGAGVGGSAGSVAAGPLQRVKAGSVEVAWQKGGAATPAPQSNVLPNGAGEYIDRILHGLYVAPGGPMMPIGKA